MLLSQLYSNGGALRNKIREPTTAYIKIKPNLLHSYFLISVGTAVAASWRV
jgi:hypothetical protein